jgi:hypothetical protein
VFFDTSGDHRQFIGISAADDQAGVMSADQARA